MNPIRNIIERICRFLDEIEWQYLVSQARPVIDLDITASTSRFPVRIAVAGEPPVLGVLVRIPTIIPEEHRPAVAEAISRMNFDMLLGAFEMDMRDGELRFRTAMPVAEAELSEAQIRHLILTAVAMADRYNRAILRLLFADDLSPAEAVAEVEMSS